METNHPEDWKATFELDINAVRMLRDHLDYAIQMWPGSPARPSHEQEFLSHIRDQVMAMSWEYNLEYLDAK